MALADDLAAEVKGIFASQWTEREGLAIPEAEDLKLGNDAVKLDGTVLYSDLSESTALVDGFQAPFAAEIYKAFLHCAAKIVRGEGGQITAYDGDRIMAVFIGETKNSRATRAALKINWARVKVINPALRAQYPKTSYELTHVTGVDTSSLYVARTGVRGANDLVWVGRAANHAAKLSSLHSAASWISAEVYARITKDVKFSADGSSMWEKAIWQDKSRDVYHSSWMYRV